jgi:hypothetical protein
MICLLLSSPRGCHEQEAQAKDEAKAKYVELGFATFTTTFASASQRRCDRHHTGEQHTGCIELERRQATV